MVNFQNFKDINKIRELENSNVLFAVKKSKFGWKKYNPNNNMIINDLKKLKGNSSNINNDIKMIDNNTIYNG